MAQTACLLLTALGVFPFALLAAKAVLRFVPRVREAQPALEAGRLLSLDGLRGYLALFVFTTHSAITWGALRTGRWLPPEPALLGVLGSNAVSLFFMVTAFLFWGRVLDKGERLSWVELYLARLARLVPLYAFALLCMVTICFALAGWKLQVSPAVLLSSLGHWSIFALLWAPLLNGIGVTGELIAGVVWTLRYEWMFYLGLPVLAFATGRWRAIGAALFGAGLLALLVSQCNPALFVRGERLLCFAGGIFAAYWVRRPALRSLARHPAAAPLVLAVLVGEIAYFDSPYAWQPLLGICAFFTVVASGNDLFGLLRSRAAVWLGEISYSLYLLHGLLLWLVFRLPPLAPFWRHVPIVVYGLAVLVLAMVLVFCASLSYFAIELPGIRLGRSACLKWRAWRVRNNAAEAICGEKLGLKK